MENSLKLRIFLYIEIREAFVAMAKEGLFKIGGLENVQINIGKIVSEEDEWEPMGPVPCPEVEDMRHWYMKLLDRYPPFYAPYCDMCCLCTFGKCDLTGNKKGACGLDMRGQQARFVLIACCMGASAHCGHGRHMLHSLIDMFGADVPVDLGTQINVEAPIMRTVIGVKPKVLGDFAKAFDYVEEQIAQMMDATHTGQEGSYLDYEAKAYHVGMLDSLAKEASDMIQMIAFKYPMGADVPLVDIGVGCVDTDKPIILVIGHNVIPSVAIIDYLDEHDMRDLVEVAGICCTAIDNTRYDFKAKVVGAIGRQLRFVRSGVADVIVVDEQCIRADIVEQAQRVQAPLIATNNKALYGLPERSGDPAEEIIEDLASGKMAAVAILDPEKVAEVVPKLAMIMKNKRKNIRTLPSDAEQKEYAARCYDCGNCVLACPQGLPIDRAMQELAAGNPEPMSILFDKCVGCGRCEQVCKWEIPIVDVMQKTALKQVKSEKFKMRVGRGPVLDTEIRNVGAPLVLGTIPGVIAVVGCGNYPDGTEDVYKIAREFALRKYIVVATGCGAMDMALYRNEEGETIYEEFPGGFEAGGVVNIGSCVSNAHIHGAAIKVASIFARRNLRGNMDEIADYILNRVGAAGVAWGAMSQKAASIGTGVEVWGVPVVVGPHGAKYRHAHIGRKDDLTKWDVYNMRDGSKVRCEPAPEHLILGAETVEEAIPLLARLCMRPVDNPSGRQIKLTHYMDLSMKYLGAYHDDWPIFVRSETDLPLARKEEYLKVLEKDYGWKIDWDSKKILEGPLRKQDPQFDPTNLERLLKGAE